jgi:hypothetical protein
MDTACQIGRTTGSDEYEDQIGHHLVCPIREDGERKTDIDVTQLTYEPARHFKYITEENRKKKTFHRKTPFYFALSYRYGRAIIAAMFCYVAAIKSQQT